MRLIEKKSKNVWRYLCLHLFRRFGHVGIYDEKFRLQRTYDIDIDTDPYADYDVAKSDPGWVRDQKFCFNLI